MMKDTALNRRKLHILLLCLGIFLLIVLFYLLAINRIGIPCLFRKVTGLMCPGCGNSRAVLALLRLDVAGALGYNLLFPVEFFYLGWVVFHCCRSYLRGKRFSYAPPLPWLDICILIAVLVWWLVRNLI
jgi:hypothetical protein